MRRRRAFDHLPFVCRHQHPLSRLPRRQAAVVCMVVFAAGGCWPASPCAPRSAPAAGPRRSAPADRRHRERLRLVLPAANHTEDGQAILIAADGLTIDQTGSHLEVVHGFHDQREAGRPVVASARDEPNADRVAPGHEPVAAVLDLVNPSWSRTAGDARRSGRSTELRSWPSLKYSSWDEPLAALA
jgi:hypothetical protein